MNEKLTRRQFIRATSGAGAGLVLAIALPLRGPLGKLVDDDPPPFSPNAWLRISRDGTVTITVAKSEMGQGVRTALPIIVAEELDADWSRVRVEQAVADNKYGSMGTGGSTSVRTSWDRLRTAGAAARMMLVEAAALRWGVPAGECRTDRGSVIHASSGRTLSYGELAEAASRLKVPENPPLKDPSEFRIIGKPIPRTDTPEKVDGSAVFGIDVSIPGLLFAAVARCPVFGGNVKSFDAAGSMAVSGVRKVVRIDSGVAVIATSTWAALQGREALRVTYDEGSAASLTSESISAMLRQFSTHPGAVLEKTGDPAAVLAASSRKIDASYEGPFLAHATMEPMNATAWIRPDRCDIWAPTQNPQGCRAEGARVSGLPEGKVTVHTTYLGGGFGRRFATDSVAEALQCSKAAGAPVKVTWTREDDIQHDLYRPVSLHILSGCLDGSGTLTALTHRIVAPSITGQRSPEAVRDGMDRSAGEGATELPYAIANFRVDYVMANTAVPIGPWRSVYPSQTVFAVESFLDELASEASKDPYRFRHDLMARQPKMQRVLDLAAEKAGWGTPLPAGRFRGIAFSPPAFFQTPVAQVVEISLVKNRVRVHRVVTAIDCGIVVNPDGVAAQMEGGVVYGLSAALHGKITIKGGSVEQGNFDDYPVLTMDEMPAVETHIVPSTNPPSGTGEPGLPAVAAAVANAVFAATGKRIRSLPITL